MMTFFSGKKKSILLFCLSIMLICNYCIPSTVWADSYTVRDGNGQVAISEGTVLHAGDTLSFEEYVDEVTQKSEYGYSINYILPDGTVLSDEAYASMGEGYTVDVRSYDGEYKERFEGWRVVSADKEMTADDGVFLFVIYVKPVIVFNISYELNGGSNSESNPATYIYGSGVSGFAPAEKDGCRFTGWYRDPELSEEITSVAETEGGDITIYAGFEAASYEISYELYGGDNSEDNPSGYTYGTVIDSLKDAVKEGYTFEGWFLDPEFETGFTGITAETFGDITLYAKFTKETDGDEDEDPADQDAQDGEEGDNGDDPQDSDSPEDRDGQDDASDQDDSEDGQKGSDDQEGTGTDDGTDQGEDGLNDDDQEITDPEHPSQVDEGDSSGSGASIGSGDGDIVSSDDTEPEYGNTGDTGRNDTVEDGGESGLIDTATAQDASPEAVVPGHGDRGDDKPFDYKKAEASTGDNTPLKLCIALLGVSALMIVFLLIKKKSKDDPEDKEEQKK